MIRLIIDGATQRHHAAENKYALAPDVVLVILEDGTGRLLDLGGDFYALSQTAAAMLSETLKGDSQTAAKALGRAHDIEVSEVARDLSAFLHDLQRRQLLSGPQKTSRAREPRRILSSQTLFPLLRIIRAWRGPLWHKIWALEMLAFLSLRLFGWPRTVRIWQYASQEVATSAAAPHWERTARQIDGLSRAVGAHHCFPIECKERALCCWVLGRWAGLPVKLIVGIDVFPLASHCWCELHHIVLSDDQNACDRFTPAITYG